MQNIFHSFMSKHNQTSCPWGREEGIQDRPHGHICILFRRGNLNLYEPAGTTGILTKGSWHSHKMAATGDRAKPKMSGNKVIHSSLIAILQHFRLRLGLFLCLSALMIDSNYSNVINMNQAFIFNGIFAFAIHLYWYSSVLRTATRNMDALGW